MQALVERVVRREFGVIEYGLIAAALTMLIGVGMWAVVAAPTAAIATQIGVDPLEIMANAKDLPPSHYNHF
jgi:hypothetical protein